MRQKDNKREVSKERKGERAIQNFKKKQARETERLKERQR